MNDLRDGAPELEYWFACRVDGPGGTPKAKAVVDIGRGIAWSKNQQVDLMTEYGKSPPLQARCGGVEGSAARLLTSYVQQVAPNRQVLPSVRVPKLRTEIQRPTACDPTGVQ